MSEFFFNQDALDEKIIEIPEERKKNEKCVFSKLFENHCRELDDKYDIKIKTRDVAALLGYKYDRLRKVINMNRPTKNRDLIIAICVLLWLDDEETDEMLLAYNMPSLDPHLDREELLFDIFTEQHVRRLNIDQVNDELRMSGFSELEINESGRMKVDKKENTNYIRKSKRVRWLTQNLAQKRDRYKTIEGKYHPMQYDIMADMIIEHRHTKQEYHLSAKPDGFCAKYYISGGEDKLELYEEADKNDELYSFYEELRLCAKKEVKNKRTYLNDSKYYDGRIGAKILDDALYAYMEKYNFIVPELNEYYLMEYKNDEFIMSVQHDSIFLQKHLSEEDYLKYYGDKKIIPKEIYHSIDDITRMDDTEKSWESREKKIMRMYYFSQMKNEITHFIEQLRKKEIYIRNAAYRYNNPSDILRHYTGMTDAFRCKCDEETRTIIDHLNEVEWQMQNGEVVLLSFEDMFQGYELGIDSVETICRIKKEKGSLVNLIPEMQK